MKTIKLLFCLLLAILAPRFASALIVGPYTNNASTLFLFHFNEAAGGSLTINSGLKGGNAYTVTNTTSGNGLATPPPVTTMLGAAGYPGFGNAVCLTNTTAQFTNGLVGFDANNSGAFQADVQGGPASPDVIILTNLYMGFLGQSSFTLEAMICPTVTNINQEIMCTDDYNGTRGFQWKITSAGQINFNFISATPNLSATIPSSGFNAFVPNTWYHVAATYDGTTVRLYWTKMDPSVTQDNLIGSAAGTIGTAAGAAQAPLIIGNENRGSSQEAFQGLIDEVRVSSGVLNAGQMMFASPVVVILQQPIGQEGVDYGSTGILTVSASSLSAMGYQWCQNTTPISGATNTTYTFTNATSAYNGNYTCVITNVNGSSITSSVASVVIGAANFLTNRYSFINNANDSIGGQNGTMEGGYTFNAGGTVTLDGSSGFVQLPTNMINTNAGAVTVETWASFGTIAANSMLFAFGNTNGANGYNYIFSTPHGSTARMAITAGTYTGEQGAVAASPLDNSNNVQLVCVFAPYINTESLYIDGVLAAVNTNATLPLSSVIDNFSYIGHSLFSADPYLAGTINEFRVYNGALSAASVQQSYLQGYTNILSDGPVAFVTSPASASTAQGLPVTFSSLTSGHQPIVYQWLKNSSPIPDATNSSYTYSPSFSDNNATFQVLATNVVGATTYFAASGTATLTVSVPTTLTWFNISYDSAWNLTSGDWNAGGIDYTQFDGVVFDDADYNNSTPGSTIDLQFAVTPVFMTVSNTAENYEITSYSADGSLAVLGTLLKQGPGTLTLDMTNNSTGLTYVQSGVLQVGNGDTAGSLGAGPVTNNATVQFNRADNIGVANALHGTGTYVVNSGGITPTATNNDYSGGTVINGGFLYATTPAALGALNGNTTVNGGGQLYITANVNIGPQALSLNGAGDGNGALRKGGAGLTAYSGAVTLTGNTSIGMDSGATLVLSNGISGASALTAIGAGTLTLTTNSTFNGGFTLNGPVVNLGSQGALGTASMPVAVTGAGRFVIGNGLNITNNIQVSTVSPGAATGLLMVNDNTNGTVTTVSGPLTFDEAAVNGGNFAGPTSSGYLNVSGPVSAPGYPVSVRFGYVRFSGGGNYSGMQVRANTSSLGADNGVSTNATMDIGGNGSPTVPTFFDLNGFNQLLVGLANQVTPANLGMVTNSSATLKTLTLNPGVGNSYSFNGDVVGNLALTVVSGTQTFTGTNNYTGNTTVDNGGTLELATASIYPNSTVNVASGGILQLDFTVTNQVTALVLGGVSQTNGVYSDNNVPAYITGSGSLLVGPTVNTGPTNLVVMVSGGNLILNWPADHTGWRLQVQTNSLNSGLNPSSNAWSTVSGSTGVNSVTNVINTTNGTVFYRMVYP